MLHLADRPVICHLLDRIKRARRVDKIIVCTSTHPEDDALEKIAREEGVLCYRGSPNDVLTRLYRAAREHGVDAIANITADCPLVDPLHIDRVVEAYESTGADFILSSYLPQGQGPYGIKVSALARVCALKAETETEVWAPYFTETGLFRIHEMEPDPAFEHSTLKTSLDYPEDYRFLKSIFEDLYRPGEVFSLADVLALIRRKPELLGINRESRARGRVHVEQTATPARLKAKRVQGPC
ncbi:MAG: NTP transferase domain-containing protein [Candidatus Omnitrophica bacterium]|nr:NTP transferase domain-containing protein [Candidatus Omnitrophota bacterium]